MAGKPPVWVRDLLATKVSQSFSRVVTPSYFDRIDAWLRTFTIDEPVLEPLGGGHFGFAYRIRKGSRGGVRLMKSDQDPTGLVLKITRDPTEGPFCRWIHEEQEKDNSLFQGAFARMYDVRTIPTVIPWRGKDWPVYFIVREEVKVPDQHDVGTDLVPGEVSGALRTLQIAGRQLAKPRKRGQATVTRAVHRGGFYLGHKAVAAEQVWEEAVGVLEHFQPFYYIWEAFWQLRNEYDIYLQDVHSANVGKRTAMPGGANAGGLGESDDWSGATDYWVIFDPGHTPTNQGLPIEALEGRAANPPEFKVKTVFGFPVKPGNPLPMMSCSICGQAGVPVADFRPPGHPITNAVCADCWTQAPHWNFDEGRADNLCHGVRVPVLR